MSLIDAKPVITIRLVFQTKGGLVGWCGVISIAGGEIPTVRTANILARLSEIAEIITCVGIPFHHPELEEIAAITIVG